MASEAGMQKKVKTGASLKDTRAMQLMPNPLTKRVLGKAPKSKPRKSMLNKQVIKVETA